MQKHHHEACQDNKPSQPAKRMRPLPLVRIHRLAIGVDLAEDKSCRKACNVRGVVNAEAAPLPDDEQDNDGGDQPGLQIAHKRPTALGGDSQHRADQSQERAACTQRKVARVGAHEKSESTCNDIQEKIARGSIQLLQRRTQLKERHHIEPNVDQSAVEKHCSDQAPPLMLDKYAVWMTGSETVGCIPAHAEKSMQ